MKYFAPVMLTGLTMSFVLFGLAACTQKVEPLSPTMSVGVRSGNVTNGWLDLICVKGFIFVSHSRGGVTQMVGVDGKPTECKE